MLCWSRRKSVVQTAEQWGVHHRWLNFISRFIFTKERGWYKVKCKMKIEGRSQEAKDLLAPPLCTGFRDPLPWTRYTNSIDAVTQLVSVLSLSVLFCRHSLLSPLPRVSFLFDPRVPHPSSSVQPSAWILLLELISVLSPASSAIGPSRILP